MTLQITPEQMAIYKRTARERQAHHEQEMRARRESAWSVARAAAPLLKERFGAKRVIAFGSLAHGAWFHARSDIDLAVEGIEPGEFFHAWATLDHLGNQFEIDLIDCAFAPTQLLDVIDEEGVEL